MTPRPGTFLWLVRHDLKLNFLRFRAMFGDRRPFTIALIVAAALVAIHVACWPVAAWFARARTDADSARLYYPMLASAAVFVIPWLISQAVMNSTRALYSRGDLDLLLASPLDARVVLAARALAIAIEAVVSVGILLFPIADMNALLGGARWLAIYPAMIASGLLATAIGLLITVGLFSLVGPSRTRFIAQIVASCIASAFVLGAQIMNILPAETYARILNAVEHPEPGDLFDPRGPLWLPVRAAEGEWADLLVWCSISIAAFAVVAVALGPYFMTIAARSAGVAAHMSRPSASRKHSFRAGVGVALRHKEWRLLTRDPWLTAQISLQVIYTLPVSVAVWHSQASGGPMVLAMAVAPCVVVMASQISASLAWLAVSSEDAPDFLATAPMTSARLQRGKIEAVGLPMLTLLAPPTIGLAFFAPGFAALMAVVACCAALSTALINLWHPTPGKRASMMRRHSQSKIIAMMEHLLAMCWALAMVLAIIGSAFAAIPIAIVGGVMWFNRPRGMAPPAGAQAAPAAG